MKTIQEALLKVITIFIDNIIFPQDNTLPILPREAAHKIYVHLNEPTKFRDIQDTARLQLTKAINDYPGVFAAVGITYRPNEKGSKIYYLEKQVVFA